MANLALRTALPIIALLAWGGCHPRYTKHEPVVGILYNDSMAGHAATEAPIAPKGETREMRCAHQVGVGRYLVAAWGDASTHAAVGDKKTTVATLDQDFLNVLTVYQRYCQIVVPGRAAGPPIADEALPPPPPPSALPPPPPPPADTAPAP